MRTKKTYGINIVHQFNCTIFCCFDCSIFFKLKKNRNVLLIIFLNKNKIYYLKNVFKSNTYIFSIIHLTNHRKVHHCNYFNVFPSTCCPFYLNKLKKTTKDLGKMIQLNSHLRIGTTKKINQHLKLNGKRY